MAFYTPITTTSPPSPPGATRPQPRPANAYAPNPPRRPAFKLQFHRSEEKEFPSIYNLTIDKGGPKLKPSTAPPRCPRRHREHRLPRSPHHARTQRATMREFASVLQRAALRPPRRRQDHGLTGKYDFDLTWSHDETQFGGGEIPRSPARRRSPTLLHRVAKATGSETRTSRRPGPNPSSSMPSPDRRRTSDDEKNSFSGSPPASRGCVAPAPRIRLSQPARNWKSSSAAQQLKYLSEDRKSLSSDCIEVAIRRLGVERYAPAVDTLITYLNFENQSLAHLHQMGLFNNPMIEHGFAYPARAALAETGVLAIDKLITAAIASESSSRIVSENAAISLTDIVTYRDKRSQFRRSHHGYRG